KVRQRLRGSSRRREGNRLYKEMTTTRLLGSIAPLESKGRCSVEQNLPIALLTQPYPAGALRRSFRRSLRWRSTVLIGIMRATLLQSAGVRRMLRCTQQIEALHLGRRYPYSPP